MKPLRYKKEYITIIILFTILLPHIVSISDCGISNLLKVNVNQKAHSNEYEIDKNILTKIYLSPQNSFKTILPIKYISRQAHQIKDHNFSHRKLDYYQTEVLSLNHPLPAYKISLTAFTSDG